MPISIATRQHSLAEIRQEAKGGGMIAELRKDRVETKMGQEMCVEWRRLAFRGWASNDCPMPVIQSSLHRLESAKGPGPKVGLRGSHITFLAVV